MAAQNREWITTAELIDSAKEGTMLYRSNATGHTFDIDKKGNESYDAPSYEQDKTMFYPRHEIADVNIAVEPDQPLFMHIPTNRRQGTGQNAQLAMSLNGLSIVSAWREISFMGFSAQGTRHVTKQDRPVLSDLRGGILTVRNTGWVDIDAGDIIVYIPGKMLRVDRYGGDFLCEYTTPRKKDNKLFRLVPMPFDQAVAYLLKVDGQCGHEILGFDVSSKTLKARRRPNGRSNKPTTAKKDESKSSSSSAAQSAASSSSSSSASASSSSSAESDVKEPARKHRQGGQAPPPPQTDKATLERRARKLLLSHFFAGKALHAAEKGANFVLHLFGTQYG